MQLRVKGRKFQAAQNRAIRAITGCQTRITCIKNTNCYQSLTHRHPSWGSSMRKYHHSRETRERNQGWPIFKIPTKQDVAPLILPNGFIRGEDYKEGVRALHKTTVERRTRAYQENIVWDDVHHPYFPMNRVFPEPQLQSKEVDWARLSIIINRYCYQSWSVPQM